MDRYDEYAEEIAGRARLAAEAYRRFDQEQVDRVVHAIFAAAFGARLELARLAHEETGMGTYDHKVLKNTWSSLIVYDDIRHQRTVGVLAKNPQPGITEIAQPKGPILATIPVTNPTSTTIFKLLICAKTRNPVILSPHRAARKCIRRTAEILSEAAYAAGAPADSVQVLTKAESEYLERLMRHRWVALILATGTADLVRRARVSGTPTLGVGPGNVPVYVHASADLDHAARSIVHSKTFDNGVVCASEQALIVQPDVAREFRPHLERRGAYFCTKEQMQALGTICYDSVRRSMRAEVVGRPASEIAELAGFRLPAGKRLIVAEPDGIGPDDPLSHEILAPVLACYTVEDYAAALRTCEALIRLGGVGHTVSLHAADEDVVSDFARLNVGRILLNQPSTEGATGGVFNALQPSLTLSCGTGARNLQPDNISIRHLLNVHRVARPHLNRRWLEISRESWLDPDLEPAKALAAYDSGQSEGSP